MKKIEESLANNGFLFKMPNNFILRWQWDDFNIWEFYVIDGKIKSMYPNHNEYIAIHRKSIKSEWIEESIKCYDGPERKIQYFDKILNCLVSVGKRKETEIMGKFLNWVNENGNEKPKYILSTDVKNIPLTKEKFNDLNSEETIKLRFDHEGNYSENYSVYFRSKHDYKNSNVSFKFDRKTFYCCLELKIRDCSPGFKSKVNKELVNKITNWIIDSLNQENQLKTEPKKSVVEGCKDFLNKLPEKIVYKYSCEECDKFRFTVENGKIKTYFINGKDEYYYNSPYLNRGIKLSDEREEIIIKNLYHDISKIKDKKIKYFVCYYFNFFDDNDFSVELTRKQFFYFNDYLKNHIKNKDDFEGVMEGFVYKDLKYKIDIGSDSININSIKQGETVNFRCNISLAVEANDGDINSIESCTPLHKEILIEYIKQKCGGK